MIWCANGVCTLPSDKQEIRWGNGTTILDDGNLNIKTDDNIYFRTTKNNKTIHMDEQGNLVLGASQKICNSNGVCVDINDIVTTTNNYGIESQHKLGGKSKMTTWGDVPGWRDGWDINNDKINHSAIKFIKDPK
jgi:hypothetical protein